MQLGKTTWINTDGNYSNKNLSAYAASTIILAKKINRHTPPPTSGCETLDGF